MTTETIIMLCHCGHETSFPEWTHCLVCRCDEHAMGYCGSACTAHNVNERGRHESRVSTMDMPRLDGPGSYWRNEFGR